MTKRKKETYRGYILSTFENGDTWAGRAKNKGFTILVTACRTEAHAMKELKSKIDVWEPEQPE